MACQHWQLSDGLSACLLLTCPRGKKFSEFLEATGYSVQLERLLQEASLLFLQCSVVEEGAPPGGGPCEPSASAGTDNASVASEALPGSWVHCSSAAASVDSTPGRRTPPGSKTNTPPVQRPVSSARRPMPTAAPTAPAPPVVPAIAGHGLSTERLTRAFEAGVVAGRKLRGEIPRVFPTRRLEGLPATRFYIVLSGRTVGELAPPCLFNSWKRTYPHVSDASEDGLLDVAVFHGFPSLSECSEYCRGAQVALPPRIFGYS